MVHDQLIRRSSLSAGMFAFAVAGSVHADALLNGVTYSTIQAAVDAAAPGDIIDVLPGTYTSGGDTVLRFLDKPITVRSTNGPAQTFIDGEGARRGVLITSPEDGPGGAILEGFTIIDGSASDLGGGVLMGGRAWMLDCRVMESTAPVGGGVAVLGAYPTDDGVDSFTGGFENVVVTSNLATSHGGGVALLGASAQDELVFRVRGSVLIKENHAGGRGGGLYLDTGSIGMISGPNSGTVSFSRNESIGTGGGLHARYSEVDFDGSLQYEFIENSSSSNGGGCALVSCEDARLKAGSFLNNRSDGADAYGGGLWARDSSYELFEVEFKENVAVGGGGGVRNRRSDALVDGCTFIGNQALGAGGGAFSSEESSDTVIRACAMSGNQADVFGGGLHMNHCDLLQLEDTVLSYNSAISASDPDHTYGGGAYLTYTNFTSTRNTWSSNTAGYGGGLYSMNIQSVSGSSASVIDSDEYDGNVGTYTSGGGIGLNGNGIYQVRSCRFTGNRSPKGSALDASGNSGVNLEIIASEFIGNGSFITDDTVTFMNAIGTIQGSVFLDNAGSGVKTILDGTVDITDSCFCNNYYGVRNSGTTGTVGIGNCRFASNITDIDGTWTELSMNYFMTTCPCGSGPDCDINGDGIVDGADLAILLSAWGTNDPDADLNGDGVVDGADLTLLLAAWN